ncbi:MAG: galactose-1-phosphate uridylyltransferase, partial [Lachnospiraceae bacterium]|nr:galactose-1-phosphate uridylyltransferase [Lachnospiraceae bacterium]
MSVEKNIRRLVVYGLQTGLIEQEDAVYTTNRLLEILELDGLEDCEEAIAMSEDELESVLNELLDYAYEHGVLKENSIVYRDLFDTKLMGALVPRPSEVIRRFEELKKEDAKAATDYFYKLSQDTDYIRRYR